MPKIIQALQKNETQPRESIVKLVCQVLKESAKGHQERTESLMFIAHQMVADWEEVLSNEGDSSASHFSGDYVWPGYGGRAGFSVIDHELVLERMHKPGDHNFPHLL